MDGTGNRNQPQRKCTRVREGQSGLAQRHQPAAARRTPAAQRCADTAQLRMDHRGMHNTPVDRNRRRGPHTHTQHSGALILLAPHLAGGSVRVRLDVFPESAADIHRRAEFLLAEPYITIAARLENGQKDEHG